MRLLALGAGGAGIQEWAWRRVIWGERQDWDGAQRCHSNRFISVQLLLQVNNFAFTRAYSQRAYSIK